MANRFSETVAAAAAAAGKGKSRAAAVAEIALPDWRERVEKPQNRLLNEAFAVALAAHTDKACFRNS